MTHHVHPTAAAGFDANAADYEKARPSYPVEVMGLLDQALGVIAGTRVCDLAAGTGKFTRLLVDHGCDVIAVEPVVGMRAELAASLPGIECVDGTAESIPLADASVDAVTVAQAFHWFDRDASLAEIARVVRPGGGLAIVFNQRDERVPWVRELSDVVEWRTRLSVAPYEDVDWEEALAGSAFVPVAVERIDWAQPMTRDLLAARVRSISYVGAKPEAEQAGFVERALALVDGFVEPFELPYVTLAVCATKR